jgi:CyaY protein
MDEATFEKLASDELRRLERALGDADDALDVDLADDVLTLEHEDGGKIVINSHRAAKQIWVAAAAGASHFAFHEGSGHWVDTRTQEELWTLVAARLAGLAGRPIALRRPA